MANPPAEIAPDPGNNCLRPASESHDSSSNTPKTDPSNCGHTKGLPGDEGKEVPGSSEHAALSQFARFALEKTSTTAEPEDTRELRMRNYHASTYSWSDMSAHVLKQERDDGSLATRSLQASLYLALTEQRISNLEHSFGQLEATVKNLPPDFSLEKGKLERFCRYRPVLKRCSPQEFDLHLPRHRRSVAPIEERKEWPALEVLTPQASASRPNDATGLPAVTPGGRGPERLRIRYRPLLYHLDSVTGERTTFVEFANEDPGVVFLRPFKFFVKHHGAIRDSLPDLHAKLREAKERSGSTSNSLEEELMSKGEGVFAQERFFYDDLIRCLELLIEFIDVDLAPVFEMREKISDGSLSEIEYADLWHLFQRGDYVLSDSKPTEVFRVVNFAGGREPLIPEWKDISVPSTLVDGFVVECTSLVFNGQALVPVLTRFRIPRFEGRRRISSLNVYPLRFASDCERVAAERLSDGQAYLDLVSQPFRHMMLRGTTLDEPPQQLEGQVVVDTVLAETSVPEWRVPTKSIPESDLTGCDRRETYILPVCGHGGTQGCCGSDHAFEDLSMDISNRETYVRGTGALDPVELGNLAPDDRMLLANWVHGFLLRSRQWVTMRVRDLYPVEFLNDFDQLILPDSHKKTIRALVEIHENTRSSHTKTPANVGSRMDLVKGKGTGLVILLHGEPGVGKTSTAECIADTTRRPLFPITCGDIGETPLEAEKNLHSNFRMAQKWGCVLLLDEADVFLAKRTQMDIRQNAITSVFLRSLEYYGGILFLTTNRVGGIDPAFKSRIHVALLYKPLDLEATKKLYSVFIDRTKEEQRRAGVARFTVKRKEILKFAKKHYKQLYKLKDEGIVPWNGRQIRNAFQTAIALVEHDALHLKEGQPAPALGAAQFEIVAEASRQFDEYLTQVIGQGEAAMAMYDKWRADPYARHSEPARKKGRSRDKYSEDEDSDDDSSSDETSDCDEDDDEDGDSVGSSSKRQEGKAMTTGKYKGAAEISGAQAVEEDSDDEMAQFEAFRRFQAMKKKSKMAS